VTEVGVRGGGGGKSDGPNFIRASVLLEAGGGFPG
jgi:hypothetical protein